MKTHSTGLAREHRPWPDRSLSGTRRRRCRAYTLVELIGVLSLVTILVTAAVNLVLGRLKRVDQLAEAATLESLARALEKVILDRRILPGTNDWLSCIQAEIDGPASRLARTRSGGSRWLLYHPGSSVRPGGVARVQTASGFQVASLDTEKILIVSLLQGSLPAGLDMGSSATFDAFWNLRPHERPAGWTAPSLPDPDDLHCVRLDLGKWLHRVTVNNLADPGSSPTLSSADNASLVTLPVSNPVVPWRAWFLHGSGLNLHGTDNQVERRETILGDRTFYFGEDGWGYANRDWVSATEIRELVADFLGATFPDAENQQRPRAAIDELYRALWAYMDWEDDGFVEGGNNKKQSPDAYVVRSTVARLNQGTLNLIGSGGGGGCDDDDDECDDGKPKDDKGGGGCK